MGEQEITAFLTRLAVDKNVAALTQNQALSAILFLYKEVLKQELGWLDNVIRAKRSVRVPEVLSPDQVRRLLGQLDGVHQLVARLLYGTGMRLMEGIRLRVQDVDFHYRQITVRDGKGSKDRVTVLPDSLLQPLKVHLARVKDLHKKDLAEGYGRVYLPYALSKKYLNAAREWPWPSLHAGLSQIRPECRARVALAVRLSGVGAFHRPNQRRSAPASFMRAESATCHQAGGNGSWVL